MTDAWLKFISYAKDHPDYPQYWLMPKSSILALRPLIEAGAASPSEELVKAADRLAGVAQAHADDYLTSTLQECIDAYLALRTTKEGE